MLPLSEGADAVEEEATDQVTVSLPIPLTDDQVNRSTSPSPAHDVIKGAETTPILPVSFDPGFGEDSVIDESNISRGNGPSPAEVISAPPPSGENSSFGPPFEMSSFATAFGGSSDQVKLPPPARPPPPSNESASAIPPSRPPPPSAPDSGLAASEETEFGEPMSSTGGPPPRPPAPSVAPNASFAAFDADQQQLIQQQQQALAAQQQQQLAQKKSASPFEDLDLAMRQKMAKPQQPVGVAAQPTPPPGVVFVPPGTVAPAGCVVMPSYGIPAGVTGFDAFGDVLQPQLANKTGQTIQTAPAPTVTNAAANQSLFKGDLDSSLASLAQNLDINGPKGQFKKPGQQQWSSPKNTVKTGAPIQPQQGWSANQPLGWNAGQIPIAAQPGMMPAGGQWPVSPVQPMMVPANSMPITYGVQMRPAMVGGMVPAGAVPVLPGAVPVLPTSTAPRPVNPGLASTQSDPFGAL